jgi:hypothetical protein
MHAKYETHLRFQTASNFPKKVGQSHFKPATWQFFTDVFMTCAKDSEIRLGFCERTFQAT